MALFAHRFGDPDGPLVLCLHGVRAHGAVFAPLARRLEGFHVVAPDLRGHGRSDWEPPWRIDDHLEDVRELLGDRRPAAVVGHSFGGRLTMELRAGSPALVPRAVLLDPAIWLPPPVALEHAERERRERTFASVEAAIAERRAFSGLHSTPDALLEREMADHLVEVDGVLRYRYAPAAVVAAIGELSRTPPPQSALACPTLLVRGALTDLVPEALVDWYREVGGLLEVVEVPGGHSVLWDAFEETAAAVERFLAAPPG